MCRCLIIDSIQEIIIKNLENKGIIVDYRPDITREEILKIVEVYEILVVRGKTRIDSKIIEKGKRLKIIARAGAGLDILDVDFIRSKDIKIVNSPEANRDAVGDHTVGMLLTLMNKLHVADRQVRAKIWDRENNRGYEMQGKIVGIVGYGNMGRAFATRLQGFGCKVIAFDKYKKEFGDVICREVSMDEVFDQADILSLHVPLTDETRGMVDEPYIDRFKKSFFLLNTARGEIVPMKSVVYGLKSEKLIGVALDVLECEKLAMLNSVQNRYFEYLAGSDKTLLTPHVGGWSYESYEKISKVLSEKIIANLG